MNGLVFLCDLQLGQNASPQRQTPKIKSLLQVYNHISDESAKEKMVEEETSKSDEHPSSDTTTEEEREMVSISDNLYDQMEVHLCPKAN